MFHVKIPAKRYWYGSYHSVRCIWTVEPPFPAAATCCMYCATGQRQMQHCYSEFVMDSRAMHLAEAKPSPHGTILACDRCSSLHVPVSSTALLLPRLPLPDRPPPRSAHVKLGVKRSKSCHFQQPAGRYIPASAGCRSPQHQLIGLSDPALLTAPPLRHFRSPWKQLHPVILLFRRFQ